MSRPAQGCTLGFREVAPFWVQPIEKLVCEQTCTDLDSFIIPEKDILIAEEDVMKDDENKLLRVISDEEFKKAPIREVIQALYYQVIQSQVIEVELRTEVKRLNNRVDSLKKVIASKFYVRAVWARIRYSFRSSEITINTDFRVGFSDTIQADLLSTMFYKQHGKPRPTKWQCAEVAAKFKSQNIEELNTARKVSKVAFRIRDKLREETGTDFLSVSAKEFFWYSSN